MNRKPRRGNVVSALRAEPGSLLRGIALHDGACGAKGAGQDRAIARSIIADKHRGKIDVRGRPGMGTEFTLAVPVSGQGAAAVAA